MWKFVENIVHRWQGGAVEHLPDGGQAAHVERIKDNKHFIRRDYSYNKDEVVMRTTDTDPQGVSDVSEVYIDKQHHRLKTSHFRLTKDGTVVDSREHTHSYGVEVMLEDALRRAMADGNIKGKLHALRCLQDKVMQTISGDGEIDMKEARRIDSDCRPFQRKKLPSSHER